MCKGCDVLFAKLESGELDDLLPITEERSRRDLIEVYATTMYAAGIANPLFMVMVTSVHGMGPKETWALFEPIHKKHLELVRELMADKPALIKDYEAAGERVKLWCDKDRCVAAYEKNPGEIPLPETDPTNNNSKAMQPFYGDRKPSPN